MSSKQRAVVWLRPRIKLVGLAGVLGTCASAARGPAAGTDLRGLTEALALAAQTSRDEVTDIRWEASGGPLADATIGRWALFLARVPGEDTRDVWRARVRVSPEGSVVDVGAAHNLTNTPLGDDHALVLRGSHAAFATRAYGQEQSITLLYLDGEGMKNTTSAPLDRWMASMTNLQQTGATEGVGRTEIALESPAAAAALSMDDAGLAIVLYDGDRRRDATPPRGARLDFARGDLAASSPGLRADSSIHLPKRFSHWLVDTLRAVPWIGPAPVAWLEDQALAARDAYRRFAFRTSGVDERLAGSGKESTAAPPLDTSQASVEKGHWPPAQVPSIWSSVEPGEGVWSPPDVPWLRKVPGVTGEAPPPFSTTFVRPDEERPYVKVILVAMDMRQLDFDMEAGVEDPEPLTGPHGSGRIPRDPSVYRRVVAAFNGAFKTEHGHYGMMVHKHVLLPPVPGAATVVVLDDQRVGLGTWGTDKKGDGIEGVADGAIVSFRQNLDPLIDHGQVNPTGRNLWGFTLPGKGAQTERTGLCVTTSGHLLYAWGEDVSATALAKAMAMGGCDYAMHLDMNPYHTGFLFAAIDDFVGKKYRSQLLTPSMSIPVDRYIQYSPKDFFYVLVHEVAPPAVAGAPAWQPDGGTQPPPSWMPGLWRAKIDDRVELLDVEPGRATWRVRAGSHEATASNPLRALAGGEAQRVLLAVGAGSAPERTPRGLATDGRLSVPVHGGGSAGALVVSPEGKLAIVRAADAETVEAHADMLELPIALWDGKTMAGADLPLESRSVIGTTPSGRVVIARGASTSAAPLADALAKAGCDKALLLDRGARAVGTLDRAGTASPPRGAYDQSVVYAIATPLRPRAFRFDPSSLVAQGAGSK